MKVFKLTLDKLPEYRHGIAQVSYTLGPSASNLTVKTEYYSTRELANKRSDNLIKTLTELFGITHGHRVNINEIEVLENEVN